MDTFEVYRLMIAGPADTDEEVAIARRLIEEWNSIHSDKNRLILRHIHWSINSHPDSGDRPQALLNQQLVENSDALIAIFNKKLGSSTGEYESGTVEEIEKHLDDKKPVLLFFRSDSDMDSFDNEEYTRLKEYKQKIQNSNSILYREYIRSGFEDTLRFNLGIFINKKVISKSKPEKIVQSQSCYLTDFEKSLLKEWVEDGHLDSVYYPSDNQYKSCKLGHSELHQIIGQDEEFLWFDFFDKLRIMGLATVYGQRFGIQQYRLTLQAFSFIADLYKTDQNIQF